MKYAAFKQLFVVFVVFVCTRCVPVKSDVSRNHCFDNMDMTRSGVVDGYSYLDIDGLSEMCPGCQLPKDLDGPIRIDHREEVDVVVGNEVGKPYDIDCIAILCVDENGDVADVIVRGCDPSMFVENIKSSLMRWRFRPAMKDNVRVSFVYAIRIVLRIR